MIVLAIADSCRTQGSHRAAKLFRTAIALVLAFPLLVGPAHAQGASDLLQSLGTNNSGSGTDGLAQQILRSLGQNGGQSTAPLQPNIQIQNPMLQNGIPGLPFNSLQGMSNTANNAGLSPLERLMSLRTGQRILQRNGGSELDDIVHLRRCLV